MPTDDQVREARAENDKLRQQIAEKQAANERLIEEANNEYRMQRYDREREELERQLAVLEDRSVVAVPQPLDETQVFADTVQPDARPEVVKDQPTTVKTTTAPSGAVVTSTTAPPAVNVPSTPTDVASIKPQGE
jgi:hypothetical protein